MSEYHIRYEPVGGTWHYNIYRRRLCFHSFFERWNTPETAQKRLHELMNKTQALA